ncbi:peroxide stress protein YaaA, partial [Bacteroides nordii]
IKATGGVLCNLASDEMRGLFDWKRIEQEVTIVTPEFHVWKNGKLSTIVVYTKMSRGEMTRFILKNRIESPQDLKAFHWEGFEFNERLSNEKKLIFTNGATE